MGIEKRVSKRAKREKIQNVVLKSLYATATIGLVVVAPNSVQLLRFVEKYTGSKPRLDRRISQAFSRLVEKGLIAKDREGHFKVTTKGERIIESQLHMEQLVKKPLRWDGKWRIVIFDVWERRRATRDRLRIMLERNGFVKIHDSVWVHPYDCEELFIFLRTNLSLGRSVLYIVAEEIEQDEWLRTHFRLRSAR